MIFVEFVHVPEGRTKRTGPFQYAQERYGEIVVGDDTRDGDRLANKAEDDLWGYDGQYWTDVIFYSVGGVD